MKRIIALLVIMAALLGSLIGCNKKEESRGGKMPEIPDLTVVCGNESITALRGEYDWKYEEEQIQEYADLALNRREETPCLKVSSDNREVSLQFYIEPLEVFVYCWDTDSWGGEYADYVEIKVDGTTFTLLETDCVYEIMARWQGDDEEGGTLSGIVYYSFYTDMQ